MANESAYEVFSSLIPKIIIGITRKHKLVPPLVAFHYWFDYNDDKIHVIKTCMCGKIDCHHCQYSPDWHINIMNYNIYFKSKNILVRRWKNINNWLQFNRTIMASDVYDIDTEFKEYIELAKQK